MFIIGSAVPQSEFGELGVDVEAHEGTVLCWGDAGEEGSGGRGSGDGLQITRLDVACRTDVKDVDLAVLRGGQVCATAESIAGENEELVVADGLDLGLSGGAGLAAGFLGGLCTGSVYIYMERHKPDCIYINVLWQWHNVFPRQSCLVLSRDIVFQHSSVSVCSLVQSTVLDHSALQHHIQALSISRDGETLKALVIAAPRHRARRNRVEIWVVDRWVVRSKAVSKFCQHLRNFKWVFNNVPLNPISLWNIRLWGPQRQIHLPCLVKFVYIRPILITDPESTIITPTIKHQSLRVHADPHATLPRTAKSISSILRCRERRESTVVNDRSGIKACNWLSRGIAQENSVYVEELHIWWGGGGGICEGGGEIDLELMEAGLPEGSPCGVPTICSVSLP